MFPTLMYKVLLLIISLSSPDFKQIKADFFLESTLAGKYDITRSENSWSFLLEDHQFSFPFFKAIPINDSEFRIIFSDEMMEQEPEIINISDILDQVQVFSFGLTDQSIMIDEEIHLEITRTTINTYFIVPEKSWFFIIPNTFFRNKAQNKKDL